MKRKNECEEFADEVWQIIVETPFIKILEEVLIEDATERLADENTMCDLFTCTYGGHMRHGQEKKIPHYQMGINEHTFRELLTQTALDFRGKSRNTFSLEGHIGNIETIEDENVKNSMIGNVRLYVKSKFVARRLTWDGTILSEKAPEPRKVRSDHSLKHEYELMLREWLVGEYWVDASHGVSSHGWGLFFAMGHKLGGTFKKVKKTTKRQKATWKYWDRLEALVKEEIPKAKAYKAERDNAHGRRR